MLGGWEPGQEAGAKVGSWAPAWGAFSLRRRALNGRSVGSGSKCCAWDRKKQCPCCCPGARGCRRGPRLWHGAEDKGQLRKIQGEERPGLADGWKVREDGGGNTGPWGLCLGYEVVGPLSHWPWRDRYGERKPRGSLGPLWSPRVEVSWGLRCRGCGTQDGGPPGKALVHQGV